MKSVQTIFIHTLSVVICCLLFSTTASAHDENHDHPEGSLIFGIAPFMSPLALMKRMAPLRNYLSQQLGVDVLIETSTDATEFGKRTLDGHYDIVLTNPTFSLMAVDKGGFQIVATQKKKMSGHFIVLNDSPIQSIQDLGGKLVGAPPRVGFMGQLIEPYLETIIYANEKMPRIKYFNSHNDAIAALRLGKTDASLIVSFMEKHLLKKGHPIRTIHRTQGYPGMTILANQALEPDLLEKMRVAMFSLDQNEQGRQLLKKISMPGFEELRIDGLETVRPYLPKAGL